MSSLADVRFALETGYSCEGIYDRTSYSLPCRASPFSDKFFIILAMKRRIVEMKKCIKAERRT